MKAAAKRAIRYGVLLCIGVGAAWLVWRRPYVLDVVRYGNIDSQCSGLFVLSGSAGPTSLSERHCQTGLEVSSSTYRDSNSGQWYSGWSASAEFARGGRFLLTGGGESPWHSGRKSALEFALLRLPGTEERWFCASGGSVQGHPHDFNGEASLTGLGAVALGTPAPSLDWTPESFSSNLGGRALNIVHRAGASANPAYTRIELTASFGANEEQTVRIVLVGVASMSGASEVALDSAFVLVGDKNWPTQRLSVVSQPMQSTVRFGRGIEVLALHLRGLTDPAACPPATPSVGTASFGWWR